ncbi:MAG: MiaB/RimO family radical SAM methylthiotransferase [Anaerolineales bacterium]
MKVFLDMVGCRLNQSEIEAYARQFRLAGHSLTSNASSADLVVINTCSVTAAAAADSRQKIRQAARSGARHIIATGCYATLDPLAVSQLSAVEQVISNIDKDNLVSMVLNIPPATFEHTTIHREPIPGSRLRTRAFIKVQDGCDNHCTYCITRLARGAGRSRTIEAILKDIDSALQGGSQEIVLTGVHLGSWGYDFSPPSRLHNLVKVILDSTHTPRLHLSSIEPWDIAPDFFELWQNPRLVRHLHLPLQSGCAATLHRMGRKITPEVYANLINQARTAIPAVSITTDIITGFPGETEEEFSESAAFVTDMKFSSGHVFTFSPRPGTAAFSLPDQINPLISKHRNAIMHQILEESSESYRHQYLNQQLSVLWEKASPTDDHLWELSGLSDNYLRVRAPFPSPCRNQIMNVRVTAVESNGLLGIIPPP